MAQTPNDLTPADAAKNELEELLKKKQWVEFKDKIKLQDSGLIAKINTYSFLMGYFVKDSKWDELNAFVTSTPALLKGLPPYSSWVLLVYAAKAGHLPFIKTLLANTD